MGKQQPTVSDQPKAGPAAPSMSANVSVSATKVAMIGQGISLMGDVKADTSLKIEGRIEGRTVQCTEEVEVAESGQVIANILAKVVKISGTVSGDIGGSEKVLITRTGRVQGNIVAPRVQLEDGALFRGSIDIVIAGACPGEPSSIIDLTGDEPVLIRRGLGDLSWLE